jgi:hypothetical protein
MKPRLSKDLGSELRILYLVSNIIQYTAVNLGCCFNNNQFSCYLYDIAENNIHVLCSHVLMKIYFHDVEDYLGNDSLNFRVEISHPVINRICLKSH